MLLRTACTVLLCCLLGQIAHSQLTLSPYSRYGLGSITVPTSTRNFAMGGIGIGAFDASSISRINPAAYADLRSTTVDLSGFNLYSHQSSATNETNLNRAGLHNLNLGFSDKNGFGLVFGLAPYGSTGYDIRLRDSLVIDGDPEGYNTQYRADGGLNQFYIGAGVRFLRNFRAGANLTFAFGNTSIAWQNQFDDAAFVTTNAEERTTLTGVIPQFGVQWGDTVTISRTVERKKLLMDRDKELQRDINNLNKEEELLMKDNAKILEKDKEGKEKIAEIEAEKKQIEGEIEELMKNEDENEKAIGRLQEKNFRLEKKRKKITRESKAAAREIRDLLARVKARRQKLQKRRDEIAEEIADIEAGNRSATTERRKNLIVRFGGIAELPGNLNGEQTLEFNNGLIYDTLYTVEGTASVPFRYGFGATISRANNWTLGLDVALQDWSNFTSFNDNQTLGQALEVRFGGEYIPEMLSRNYLRRVAYRGGLFYNSTGILINNEPVQEYGVNIGLGIPIGRFNPINQNFSRFNVGFSVSQRGNLSTNPLEELNFQVRLGVNISEIWFIRRRID